MARYAATRVVGLAALGGFAALGLGAVSTVDASAAASGSHRANAADASSSPVTSSVSFTIDLRLQMPKQFAVGWHATGKADFTHHSAQETVTVPTSGLRPLGVLKSGLIPGNKPLVLEMQWIDGRAYMTVPASLSHVANGASALSFPVSAADVAKIDLELDQSAVALTYAKALLSELAESSAQHHVGTRTIDGVPTSGTSVDLTLGQLLKVSPGLSPTMMGDLSMFGDEMLPVTVWIDHAGRLRQATIASAPKGAQPSISGMISFSNFNVPVTITAPPSAEVKPMSAAMQQLLNGLGPLASIPLP